MATYLNAPSGRFGTPTNAKKYTISTWIKPAVEGNDTNNFFNYNYGSGNQAISIQIRNNDQTLRINQYVPGTDTYDIRTNRVFRDPSAWYHIVIKYDSTQSTASDRVKLYVNGENQTSLAASSYPGQNVDSFIASTPNNNKGINIGGQWDGSGNITANQYFLGYMAQFIYTDGYAYDASTFGSTNANGIWVPNTGPSVTYGTNGFKLDFAGTGTAADASGFGADSSGNNNHFASNSLGTNPSTTDTCQNNFATFNSLDKRAGGVDFSLGNTKVVTSGSNRNYVTQTQAFASGKWYMECRFTAGASNGYVGFCDMSDLQMTGTSTLGDLPNEARVNSDGSYEKNNSSTAGWAGSFTDNDILGLALDCDNNRFTLSKNGQWADGSGNYDEANPTVYITYTAGNFMSFAFGEGAGGATATIEINTGNAPYTISSGNADGAGYGNFEYAVPSGYYALCTKNLAAYGG